MKKTYKIVFTGGGTGGHLFPIIAIARELKKEWERKKISDESELELYFIGPKDKFSQMILEPEGFKIYTIFSGKIRRYINISSLFQNLRDLLFSIPLGIFQSFFYLFFLAPDLIFSKGGYGSIPVVFNGWLLRIPILSLYFLLIL